MNKELLKLITVNRDAISVNRGFYYQYLNVLLKWVEHYVDGNDTAVYTEVGDDIKEVGDQLVFSQIKCYTSTFSLKSPEVTKALFNFFVLYLQERESNPAVSFVFQTNTGISDRETLLTNWIASKDDIPVKLLSEIEAKIKSILETALKKIRDGHLSASSLSGNRKNEIKANFKSINDEITAEFLTDFTKRIGWDFSGHAPEAAVEKLYNQILALLSDPVFDDKPPALLMEVLLSEIYRCSQLKDAAQRMVNRNLLNNILTLKTEELDQYSDRRFLDLLDQRFSQVYKALNEMQQDIKGLKTRMNNADKNTVPHQITAIPFIKVDGVYQRELDVEELHKKLSAVKHLAINGTGGIGKSTLAKYYLQTHEDKFDHVIWLNAEPGILKSILYQDDLLANLEVSFTKPDSEEKLFREVLRKINSLDGNNLLVIDDFNDEQYLNELFALKYWKVLFTTRKRLPETDEFGLSLLTTASATQLYRKFEPKNAASEAELREFFIAVDYNPLIIEISAKTIHNSADLDLARFSTLLQNQALDDEELEIDISGYPIGNSRVLQILKKTFDISGLEPDEAYNLCFFATLPSDFKISDLVTWYGEPWAKGNKPAFANIINSLHQKGWLERTGDDVNLHRAIQESILYRMRSGKEFLGIVQQLGWLSHRLREGTSANYNQALQFLRYGESILSKIRDEDRESIYQPLLVLENEVLNVYNWIIGEKGKLQRLESLLQRSVEYLGAEDQFVGIIHNNLGMAYGEKADYDAAYRELSRANEILKKSHKGSETQLMYAMCNLAMLYIQTGQFLKFQAAFDETMAVRKKNKWFDDPSFPFQCGMLGFAQQSVGNYKEAIRLYLIAIKTHQALPAKNKNDLNLILYLNNLSYSYFKDGQEDKAMVVIGQAVDQLEKLSVKNDNKLFAILLTTLIEIVEKLGTPEELTDLLTTLENIRQGNN
jgi:tetratricopeptide (TPR) repeat protein